MNSTQTIQAYFNKDVPRYGDSYVFKAIDHAKRFDRSQGLLTNREWSEGSKSNAGQAYKGSCEANNIQIPKGINFSKWSRHQRKLPWIPLEKEIDSLIAGCSRKIACSLQLIKETWCRAGEAWRLEWTVIDSEQTLYLLTTRKKRAATSIQSYLQADCHA